MWHYPTSMFARTASWIVIAIVVAAAAGGVGYVAGSEDHTSPSQVLDSTLSIDAAGSLTGQFPQLATLLVNETPGISAPSAAQDYEGSLDIVNGFTELGAKADVAALADFRLIPQLLEPKYAGFEVAFGTTPEVLAYNPAVGAFDGINSSNWGWVLANAIAHGAAPLGVWNASTDPNGYNEIFSMELQGAIFNGSNLSVYSHFYSGAPGSFAVPNPATTLPEHESMAAELIKAGTVSAVITYRSYAVANNLTFVPFNSTVGLSATGPTALADYAALSTEIERSSGGKTRMFAAPVVFAVTVPSNAPNPALGAAFIHLLLSPQGSAILSRGGAFTPIFPGWLQASPGIAPPSAVAPDVVPLPGWASALLP
jgi:molybdate/tungstate transport system substrate-binding protein